MKDRKEALLALKQELSARIDRIDKTQHSRDTSSKSGEQSVQRQSDGVKLNLKNEAEVELEQIEVALVKLSNDVYGICEKCHEEISAERLDAIPFATRCKDCAE